MALNALEESFCHSQKNVGMKGLILDGNAFQARGPAMEKALLVK